MSLKHGILGLLNCGPTTGYELDKAFKGSLNYFWQAQTSQIYRELSAMEKLGWITAEIVIQTDKPNKKVFTLTGSGREELHHWLLQDSIEEDIRVRVPFLMKLFFSGEVDTAANLEMITRFRQCCEDALEKMNETTKQCEEECADDKNAPYWGMTASFGRYYYDMCIRWAEDTLMELKEMR